jgi:nitrogen-specific signal transduction histidine kinase
MVNNNTIKMQKIIERAAMLQNHQPDDLQRIQASSLLDKVITMAHIQRPHKDVCIEWSVAADMPDLTVCEARIEIALMELIRNALEAAGPSGTVTLRAFYQSESEQFVFHWPIPVRRSRLIGLPR